MKIGILSDIHGNSLALKTILKELEEENISNIIIAGDIVGECPDNNEVIEIARALTPWVIKGNKEQYILDYQSGETKHWKEYKQMAAMMCVYESISEENFEYIEKLPEEITINLKEKGAIRVVHGYPGSLSKGIWEKDFPGILHEVASMIDEQVLICGHTHTGWFREVDEKLIINPGSLGAFINKERKPEYAVISWEENKWNVELRTVDFCIDELEKRFIDSEVYTKARAWCRIFLQSLRDGEFRNIEFIEFAKDIAKSYGIEDTGIVPNEIWDKAEESWFNDQK